VFDGGSIVYCCFCGLEMLQEETSNNIIRRRASIWTSSIGIDNNLLRDDYTRKTKAEADAEMNKIDNHHAIEKDLEINVVNDIEIKYAQGTLKKGIPNPFLRTSEENHHMNDEVGTHTTHLLRSKLDYDNTKGYGEIPSPLYGLSVKRSSSIKKKNKSNKIKPDINKKRVSGLKPLMGTGNAEFNSAEESNSSPLAKRLFLIDGIQSVFLGSDFIAVTKTEAIEWFSLKPAILAGIMEHYASGLPVIESINETISSTDEADSETVQQIKHLIDTRVRPAVAMDGGDIIFSSYDDGVVTLQMRGACQGCPSSAATLKMGIENMLRHYIPEVKEVRPAGT
jgi:Fe-S cluster biogenesis protein NfuA